MTEQPEQLVLSFIQDLETLDSTEAITERAVDLARPFGVVCASYHYLPCVAGPEPGEPAHYRFGFPDDWTDTLAKHGANVCDAVRRYAASGGKPRWLSEAPDMDGFSKLDQACLAAYRTLDIADLLGVPLRGPMGQNGYVGIGFAARPADSEALLACLAQCAAQALHNRYIALLPAKVRPILSDREGEVLYWMARGHSNAAIAMILGVSANTVDTYVRRVFAKLGVTDRIGASLVGSEYGLLYSNAEPGCERTYRERGGEGVPLGG